MFFDALLHQCLIRSLYVLVDGHGFQKTDSRMASIEVKVKKLDGELARYKEQMSKLRNGPGKVRFRCLMMLSDSALLIIYPVECHSATRSPYTQAETYV
jgi:hypothetical protein